MKNLSENERFTQVYSKCHNQLSNLSIGYWCFESLPFVMASFFRSHWGVWALIFGLTFIIFVLILNALRSQLLFVSAFDKTNGKNV